MNIYMDVRLFRADLHQHLLMHDALLAQQKLAAADATPWCCSVRDQHASELRSLVAALTQLRASTPLGPVPGFFAAEFTAMQSYLGVGASPGNAQAEEPESEPLLGAASGQDSTLK